MTQLALEGLRIIDVSMWWAGPFVTQLLGDMGAEIIKIESIQVIDGWRRGGIPRSNEDDRPYERSSVFNGVNRNKYEITLDLARPKGADIFKRLVALGDVVVENYTPRVMENFGLDYAVLREVNPRIVMVSVPGFGMTGPWKDYPAFAFPVEEMAGIPQLTGYEGGPPMLWGNAAADAIAGLNGAFAVLAALEYRRRTGKGQYIDLSQVEALTCLIGEAVIDYSMNQRLWPRRGNRHPCMAPHGCYRCKGEDRWVTIAVSSDEEWKAFCDALGNPEWTRKEEFATALGRWKNQDELEVLIEEWTLQHDHYEVMHLLQGAGIAAGPVLEPPELLVDPHLKERGFYEWVERADMGVHPHPGMWAKLSKTPGRIRMAAPYLGEHNEMILGKLLGITKEEMAELAEEQIIGTVPLLNPKR